jgi:hypothetical protein
MELNMSWYPTQTNALYVTEELEQESTEYVDSQGRHFIDVNDVVVDHKTAKGYIAIDSASIAIVVDDNFQNQNLSISQNLKKKQQTQESKTLGLVSLTDSLSTT